MRTAVIFTFLALFAVSNGFSQTFDKIWSTDPVFKTPESVYFDEARNQLYVSNINGKPTMKDGNGFISLLGTDGKIKKLQWITGMHAPKGMAVVGKNLYVTDIDRIHVIDIDQARIIKTHDIEGAMFLNDIAADLEGNLYISDMKTNQLLYADSAGINLWLEDEKIIGPNGMAFFKGQLYVGVKNQLLKINPADKKIRVHVEETGPIDGLILLGGNKFVISDWSGRILKVSPTEKFVLSNTTESNIQAADLGFIPAENLVLVPTFFDNRVVAYRLP